MQFWPTILKETSELSPDGASKLNEKQTITSKLTIKHIQSKLRAPSVEEKKQNTKIDPRYEDMKWRKGRNARYENRGEREDRG